MLFQKLPHTTHKSKTKWYILDSTQILIGGTYTHITTMSYVMKFTMNKVLKNLWYLQATTWDS